MYTLKWSLIHVSQQICDYVNAESRKHENIIVVISCRPIGMRYYCVRVMERRVILLVCQRVAFTLVCSVE
jgi:hypothetical protein